ncbi:DUF6584 family protein [Goodfellowiella coeruleoviolacea]|uniref:Uncharacterized protein n=1 Tax=Goodfellowiella coeruleoviolacea TaxID=334858 RepID=A0AAE3GKY5_9PSEU|nr:DUF6584 family protein [Goodfellowiella coeruleoviolacea]MCP2167953.1 hypothetical protein [Goodfellowiella coeruleoviolacea]
MTIETTLSRVDRELAAGDLASVLRARQRLRGLVGTYPSRLDLRERLAGVYRRLGDAAQAGRWSYLAEQRDPAEVAAFERAYRAAVARMSALGWTSDPDTATTATARSRLAEVLAAARAETGRPLAYDWAAHPEEPGERLRWWQVAGLVLLGVALVVFEVFAVGNAVVTVGQWLTSD